MDTHTLHRLLVAIIAACCLDSLASWSTEPPRDSLETDKAVAVRPAELPLGDVDRKLRETMQRDPTFTSDSSKKHGQKQAIDAWHDFLAQKDLTGEQQIFAWWRIGSLAAYNFDASSESANVSIAANALQKVHELGRNRISIETLNAATVYGGLMGEPADRASRQADAYRWLFTRTDAMARESARHVNHNGYGIDDRLMLGGMRLNTIAEKREFLRASLLEHQTKLSQRISEEIQSSENPQAIESMLLKIGEVGDRRQIEKWRAMLPDVRARQRKVTAGLR